MANFFKYSETIIVFIVIFMKDELLHAFFTKVFIGIFCSGGAPFFSKRARILVAKKQTNIVVYALTRN